ncbi:MAG: hypothetical protein ACI9DK_001846 [Vicingaceae bacterium]|jgi:hypothetical protein
MKYRFLALLIFLSSQFLAQEGIKFSDFLQESKISNFTDNFSKTIDLTLPNVKANYGNKQAQILVHNFFKKWPNAVYSKKHSGGGNGRPNFEIGSLTTSRKTYRTYLLYNTIKTSFEVIEFRVEPE